jgi:hypothetical protein
MNHFKKLIAIRQLILGIVNRLKGPLLKGSKLQEFEALFKDSEHYDNIIDRIKGYIEPPGDQMTSNHK